MARAMAATAPIPETCGAVNFRLHRGERFWYVYDFEAYWQCDIRLEASLPVDAKRSVSRVYRRQRCRTARTLSQPLGLHGDDGRVSLSPA